MRPWVTVEGVEGVAEALRRLNVAAALRVIEAVEESAGAIAEGAQSRAPMRRGRYRRSIRPKFSRGGLEAAVAPWGRGGRVHPLAHIFEFGARAHVIRAKKKKALRFETSGGEEVLAAEVHHPGLPPRPHLFPAFEEERPRYVARLERALNQAGKDAAR